MSPDLERPDSDSSRRGVFAWLRRNLYILIPCLLIVAYAAPLVGFQIPNNFDELDESFEPIKTLKFVHTKGQATHKWGPMPNLLYAPAYAPFLGYWKLSGDFARPSADYPYGFARPFEQQGTLIVVARLIGLAVGLVMTAAYARSLARWTGSRWAVLAALVGCLVTSPDILFHFVATKPDGLMLAFLIGSMAAYAAILDDGLTIRRGAWLSIAAVASLSCKEQTLPAYLTIYPCVLLVGPRGVPLSRFLGRYAVTILIGVFAYLMINVIYAPSSWLMHVREWIGGPGKDPAVWAGSGYSLGWYLRDTGSAIAFNLGPGGLPLVAVAGALAVLQRPPGWILAWLPLVGYIVLMTLMAGYMPRYFMGPVPVLAVLPVAQVIAVTASRSARWAVATRFAAIGALAVTLALSLWSGNYAWAQLQAHHSTMVWDYCRDRVGKDERIHLTNLFDRQPGAHRLSYAGYQVDDRALGALLEDQAELPDVIIISRESYGWLEDFRKRPKRNQLMEASGYSYDRFEGFEPLGYHQIEVVAAKLPAFLQSPWFPWPPYQVNSHDDLLIYRRDRGARQ